MCQRLNNLTKYKKEHANIFGEVFTDFYLIEEHVPNIDPELFKVQHQHFLILVLYLYILIEKLMEGLEECESNPEKR